ncbi:MAG: FliH/SctL family protein, partial [Nitrospirota bacterium]|nr:FliH/SctL family protein [Nitrospirota bacterium]
EGFASGENAGFAAGEQKALLLTDRLEKIIGELTALKERLIREAETQVVDLAVSIAAKITVGEINTKPEIIISMVRESLKRLQVVGPITIKINPALYDLFTAKKPELTAVHEDIVFDVNPNVPVTGPLVISQTQEVVTDIESLFRNILKEIKIIDRTRNTVPEGDEEEEGAAE